MRNLNDWTGLHDLAAPEMTALRPGTDIEKRIRLGKQKAPRGRRGALELTSGYQRLKAATPPTVMPDTPFVFMEYAMPAP